MIIGVLGLALMSVTQAVASITIDFESFPAGPFAAYTEQGVTFSASGGGGAIVTGVTPNGTLGLGDTSTPRKELRADISGGTTSVSVDLGDYDADSDRLFLEVFDVGNNLLGYVDWVISENFSGMLTLSTLPATNIAYAVFGARDAVNGSSVYADNFTFEPIPAPGALLLGGIGAGLVGWLRRRRTL
jgi:hypothetical protein